MTFGERLQNLIIARTDGNAEAYEKLLSDTGISATRMIDLILDKDRPTERELTAFIYHLGTTLDYLTGLKDIDGNVIYFNGKNSGYVKRN